MMDLGREKSRADPGYNNQQLSAMYEKWTNYIIVRNGLLTYCTPQWVCTSYYYAVLGEEFRSEGP
jgi:hypothetical protein